MPDGGGGERAASRRGSVAETIARRVTESGPIPFKDFMEAALYSPEGGYYTSGRKTWGPGGDYITSLDVSPFFARTLARQLVECWELLGSPSSFELVEAGAGRGWLALGMLDHVKEACPGLYDSLNARLVDVGGQRPSNHGKVKWARSLDELEPAEAAFFISNELIDSFAVHRVVFASGALRELYVGFDGASFFETEGPLSDPALEGYFERAGVEPFEGMKTEVNLEAGRWVGKASSLFERGFVVTVDYGSSASELYSPERNGGSLHCHFRHTLNDNPFANIGEQDMTTHVDFTTVALDFVSSGMEITGFTTQKNFLLGLGILEALRTPASFGAQGVDDVNHNRAIGALIAPGGMGDTFKVLAAHKGLKRPSLKGFSFKDMTRSLGLR